MQCSTDSQRQDNCNATLSLTSSSLVCLYTDEEDLGWRLSSTFHFTIRCKLQQVSTVKLTGLQSCVCVPERGFSQSVGGQLIGFFLHLTWPSEWARVGFMCVHPTVQVCWWVHSVHTWQPTCVVVFFCCFLGEGGGYMSVCEFDFVYTCQTADSFWVWKGTVYRLTAHREELFGGQILPMCKASCWQSGVKGWSCQVFLFLPICLFLPFTALSLILCQHRLFFPPISRHMSPCLSWISSELYHSSFLFYLSYLR